MERYEPYDFRPYWDRFRPSYRGKWSASTALENRNGMAAKFAQHRGEPVVLLTTDGRLVYAPPGPHHVPSPEPPYDIGYFYREDRVYDEDSDAIKELKEYGHILKFVKVLGQGGQGIVALCEVRGPPGKGLEKCVIKMARGPGSQEVHRELLVMDHLRGPKHLVQYHSEHPLLYHAQKIMDGEKDAGTLARAVKHYYDRDIHNTKPKFMVLEHMELGIVAKWIGKSSKQNTPWPDRMLWLMFECLVQGLIGMAYPVHGKWDTNVEEEIPLKSDGTPETPCDLVHFDIDPLNVLVGFDPDNPKLPIFKIADFGLATNFSSRMTEQYPERYHDERYWRQRTLGKTANFTPEQFHSDWDRFTEFCAFPHKPGVPYVEPRLFTDPNLKPEIAGNYAMHTNIFQIGIMMWCAMLSKWWNQPVEESVMLVDDDEEHQMTYGGALDDHPDKELASLVQRCLATKPSLRPSLQELQNTIRERKRRGFPGWDDKTLEEWCRVFFEMPGSSALMRKRHEALAQIRGQVSLKRSLEREEHMGHDQQVPGAMELDSAIKAESRERKKRQKQDQHAEEPTPGGFMVWRPPPRGQPQLQEPVQQGQQQGEQQQYFPLAHYQELHRQQQQQYGMPQYAQHQAGQQQPQHEVHAFNPQLAIHQHQQINELQQQWERQQHQQQQLQLQQQHGQLQEQQQRQEQHPEEQRELSPGAAGLLQWQQRVAEYEESRKK